MAKKSSETRRQSGAYSAARCICLAFVKDSIISIATVFNVALNIHIIVLFERRNFYEEICNVFSCGSHGLCLYTRFSWYSDGKGCYKEQVKRQEYDNS